MIPKPMATSLAPASPGIGPTVSMAELIRGFASMLGPQMLTPRLTSAHCDMDAAGLRLLESAIRRMSLSARGFDRVRKVARTIADLAADDRIRAEHVAEALQFRME